MEASEKLFKTDHNVIRDGLLKWGNGYDFFVLWGLSHTSNCETGTRAHQLLTTFNDICLTFFEKLFVKQNILTKLRIGHGDLHQNNLI